MPKIEKQTPKPVAGNPAAKNVLERIAPLSHREKGIKLALYGRSGSGKTRLACTFPKNLLLIGTEDGTDSVSTDKGVDFVPILKSEEIRTLVDFVRSSRKYATVVLDTGTMLQDLLLREILGVDSLPAQKSWGMATREQYGQLSLLTKEYFRSLLDLSVVGIHVVIICQERNFNDESNSDLIAPSVGSALTPAVTGWLHPACDYVGQTYIRSGIEIKKVKVEDKVVEISQPSGKMEFCLRTGVHEVYATKFRLPRGNVLPEAIVDPTFDKIYELLRGK